MDFFIAVYTHEVKKYCDNIFFNNLFNISNGNQVHIVDNSFHPEYTERIKFICKEYTNFEISRIGIPQRPLRTLFLRNVADSANFLREKFLKTDCKYFLVIESDVIPPHNTINKFSDDIKLLPENWGILGAIYYKGFHDYSLKGIQQAHHILSGCSVYSRDLIEKFPFRWSTDAIGSFPDSWMSMDATNYWKGNDHDIICQHHSSDSPSDLIKYN